MNFDQHIELRTRALQQYERELLRCEAEADALRADIERTKMIIARIRTQQLREKV